jgi:hypothetical protein
MRAPHSTVIGAVAIALIAAPAVGAQSRVSVGIGAGIPIGTTADRVNPGYSSLLSYAVRARWLNRNHIRLEVGVTSFPERSVPDERRQIISSLANLVIVGTERPGPLGYVIIGAGSYQESGALVARHNDPGVNIGAGIQFSMGFFGTFVEARLHYINDSSKTKYFPMTFGLTF